MNERDFRRRVRAVLGEPPGHAGAVERLEGRLADSLRSAARAERHHPRGMTLVAGALALLRVAALLAPQIAGRTRGPQPSPTTSPAPKDPHDCRLPVVIKAVWPPRSYVAGFVSLQSGDFAEDPSAPLDRLPNSEERVAVPATYDPMAGRWLPVPSTAVPADHRSYAFVKARANTSRPSVWELRVFELDSMRDRLVWSSPGEIGHVTWSGDGIESAPPSGGGFTQAWRIAPRGRDPREIPLPPWARPTEWGPDWIRAPLPFHDARGRWLLVEKHGTTNRGMNFDLSRYSLVGPGGQRAQVWSGADPYGWTLSPSSWFLDGNRLWIGSSRNDVFYLWTAQDGLERFHVKPKWETMQIVGPWL